MKKLTIGDLMTYWGIEGVKKSTISLGKYEAFKGNVSAFSATPLQAVHTLVSAIKEGLV